MYEIPEILMFVCAILLMGILATDSVRLRALYGTLFLASVGVITVMLAGAHMLLDVLPLTAVVLALIVSICDEVIERYSIQATTQLTDHNDHDKESI